jgi:DNA primase
MARIPEAEIERLKREVGVGKLAEARGVKLVRHGADLIGLCPFHADREPSLVISPAKNLWHCLGACQAGGSAIDWVMRAEGVSFRLAAEMLRSEHPSFAAAGEAPPPKRATVAKLGTIAPREAGDDELMERVIAHYQTTLRESPEALLYLEQRGIRDDEAIETFRIGYANRTLGYRLPRKTREEGAELRARLMKLGLYRESGHEHFCGSLVIPIADEGGRVVEMYGRKIGTNLRPGTPLHLYLPGPHRGVWNAGAVKSVEEVVLCESLIDALTFWCAGIRNVTAAYGVEGFTAEHREVLRAAGTRRVKIAYDRDEAGDRAAEKLSRELSEEGIETFRVQFPKGIVDGREDPQKNDPPSRRRDRRGEAARSHPGVDRAGSSRLLSVAEASWWAQRPPLFESW